MTDRDAALREARRLEGSYAEGHPYVAALRATRMPIVISDALQPDCPIVFANRAFVRLSGYDAEEIIGRNCRFLQGPDTDRREVARIAAALKAHESIAVEILNYRKDGTSFWNALSISPVFDAEGRTTHFFGSQLDVTEKNRTAIELRAANELLSKAKEAAESLVEERTRGMRRALEQKTTLLHEVDHRIKNNLQLISALIQLQSRRLSEREAAASLRALLQRVSSLATAHRKLYENEDAAAFDVAAFIRELAGDLIGATGRDDVALVLELEPVVVGASQSAPVALLINEMLTNAVRHAFPDRGGRIRIAARHAGRRFEIEIEDDGVGIGVDSRPGFGQSLIDLLGKQLAATVLREDAAPGVRMRIVAPAVVAKAHEVDVGS